MWHRWMLHLALWSQEGNSLQHALPLSLSPLLIAPSPLLTVLPSLSPSLTASPFFPSLMAPSLTVASSHSQPLPLSLSLTAPPSHSQSLSLSLSLTAPPFSPSHSQSLPSLPLTHSPSLPSLPLIHSLSLPLSLSLTAPPSLSLSHSQPLPLSLSLTAHPSLSSSLSLTHPVYLTCHAKTGPNLPLQQWFQPLFLLLFTTIQVQYLHVAWRVCVCLGGGEIGECGGGRVHIGTCSSQ